MEFSLLIKAAILGVVEGLTEFLPISSTGHLILAGSLLDFTGQKSKVFEIAIQSGAILAVIAIYFERLVQAVLGLGREARERRFVTNVALGFLPAAVFGLLLGDWIQAHLMTPVVVATSFILGGIVILLAERRGGERPRVTRVDDMTPLDALKVGLVQCLAMIPGTSRSGATIIGGMFLGLSRRAATEFSFFLAIPTLVAAGAYSLLKERALLSTADLPLFTVGFVFALVSAWVAARWLLRYVATHTFVPFAWYRIVFGLVVLATALSGLVSWKD